MKWVIAELECLQLPAATRMALARRFNVVSWIPAAFETLVCGPLNVITADDRDVMGIEVYAAISNANSTMWHTVRCCLIMAPPLLPPDSLNNTQQGYPNPCTSHNRCIKVWNETWMSKIIPLIFHAEHPLAMEMITVILNDTPHPGMTPECRSSIIARVNRTKSNIPGVPDDERPIFVTRKEKALQPFLDTLLSICSQELPIILEGSDDA